MTSRDRSAALDALRRACPTAAGTEADAVDGVVPDRVAWPGDVEEAAGLLRVAAEHGLRVVPRGAGTQLDRGGTVRGCELVVDTGRLDSILEHASGDLVCRAGAGVPLRQLQEALAPYGQHLALDGPTPHATLGGVLSTAASGPLRLGYGTPRDLLIGITVVLADGTVARSGGKVVKNVAGYDLGKLYTGAFGTLGLIVDATFRLHPVPAERAYLTGQASSAADAYAAVHALGSAQLAPSAIEVDQPEPGASFSVGVLIEGGATGVARRARQAARLLEEVRGVERTDHPPAWWGPLTRSTVVRLTFEKAALPMAAEAVASAGASAGLTPCTRGSAAVGVLHVGLPASAEPPAVGLFLDRLRAAVAPRGGSAVLQRAPAGIRGAVDVWGPVPGAGLMRRVKERFDPRDQLCPGRFVEGTGAPTSVPDIGEQ